MARYIFSNSYAATVLPIIREIHREILAQKPPGAAISNRAIDRAIARALETRGRRNNARGQLDAGAGCGPARSAPAVMICDRPDGYAAICTAVQASVI